MSGFYSKSMTVILQQPPTVTAKFNHRGQNQCYHSFITTSYLTVDDQQLMFALSPAKTFNPPSVAYEQQEESQQNTSGLSSLTIIKSHHNHFPPLNFKQHHHQCKHIQLNQKTNHPQLAEEIILMCCCHLCSDE